MVKLYKKRYKSEKIKQKIIDGTFKTNLPKEPWNKGIKIDKEKYPNFSWRGKKRPDMIGNKYRKGIHPVGEFKKGMIPWNKGKKLPQISGKNHPMYGKHHSEETRKLIGLKGLGRVSHRKGKKGDTNSGSITKERRKNMILPIKDTSIEVKIQNFLKKLKIEFLTHQYMNLEHAYQCDILIPSKNIVIECFGDYWHKYPIPRDIDTLRCIELRKKGYKVLVFWEREIKVMNLDDLKNKLEIIN